MLQTAVSAELCCSLRFLSLIAVAVVVQDMGDAVKAARAKQPPLFAPLRMAKL